MFHVKLFCPIVAKLAKHQPLILREIIMHDFTIAERDVGDEMRA